MRGRARKSILVLFLSKFRRGLKDVKPWQEADMDFSVGIVCAKLLCDLRNDQLSLP